MTLIKLVKFKSTATSQDVREQSNIEFEYNISNFISISYDVSTPITPAPLPEEDASQNILVKLEGNTSKIKFTWWIQDQTESVVPGMNVKTVIDQMNFFKNIFSPVSITDAYALVYIHTNDTRVSTRDEPLNYISWEGSISNTNFSTTEEAPVTFRATTDFLQGTVISVFDLDKPVAPKNLTLSSIPGGLRADWEPSNSNPGTTIAGWITRITNGSGHQEIISRNNTTPVFFNFTGLITGQYKVEVAAVTSDGSRGLFAEEEIFYDAN